MYHRDDEMCNSTVSWYLALVSKRGMENPHDRPPAPVFKIRHYQIYIVVL